MAKGSGRGGDRGGSIGGARITEIAGAMKGVDFPADRESILERARRNGAGAEVIGMFEGLPDAEFETVADVMAGVSGR